MVSQKEIVLEALKRGERLTSFTAAIDYGVMDLPKRISELRRDNVNIVARRIDAKNRRGAMTHWNEYSLCEPTSTSR